jgi:hypothetical protein
MALTLKVLDSASRRAGASLVEATLKVTTTAPNFQRWEFRRGT